jgi:hypothetical protein
MSGAQVVDYYRDIGVVRLMNTTQSTTRFQFHRAAKLKHAVLTKFAAKM